MVAKFNASQLITQRQQVLFIYLCFYTYNFIIILIIYILYSFLLFIFFIHFYYLYSLFIFIIFGFYFHLFRRFYHHSHQKTTCHHHPKTCHHYDHQKLTTTHPHQVSLLVRKELIERAKDFNIILDDVAITELAFGPMYTQAVEAKQVTWVLAFAWLVGCMVGLLFVCLVGWLIAWLVG